jgi:hypothetical protein
MPIHESLLTMFTWIKLIRNGRMKSLPFPMIKELSSYLAAVLRLNKNVATSDQDDTQESGPMAGESWPCYGHGLPGLPLFVRYGLSYFEFTVFVRSHNYSFGVLFCFIRCQRFPEKDEGTHSFGQRSRSG